MSGIRLRRARPDDIERLQDWVQNPHVRAALGEEEAPDWEADLAAENEWQEPLIAELDGRPIAYVEIIDPAREPSHYWGEAEDNLRALDIWIGDASDLGKGYGTMIMEHALSRCFTPEKIAAVIIDPLVSNKRAIQFYERLGFQRENVQQFDGNDCLVMRITRAQWEESNAAI